MSTKIKTSEECDPERYITKWIFHLVLKNVPYLVLSISVLGDFEIHIFVWHFKETKWLQIRAKQTMREGKLNCKIWMIKWVIETKNEVELYASSLIQIDIIWTDRHSYQLRWNSFFFCRMVLLFYSFREGVI